MQFVNPALLFGTLLFAVPLVIHLLNRQRHKRRPWAAMEFLMRAFRKQRRRLRRENLLLLLLRCLLPILLALAIARPVLRESGALSGLGGTAHHVIVLDSSYSMAHRPEGGNSAFERGRALVVRLLDRLASRTDQSHKVTVVTAGQRTRFLVQGELNLQGAKARVLQVDRPEDAATDLSETMSQVARHVADASDPEILVYLLTDLQARAFGKDAPEPGPGDPEVPTGPVFEDTVRDAIEAIGEQVGAEFVLIDVGPTAGTGSGGKEDNVQITGLRVAQTAAVARVPITVLVALQNQGLTTHAAQVTLEVDGAEPSRRLVSLDAGAEAEAEFQVVFRETGRRRLHASLLGDSCPADDEWFHSLDVRERISVLMVDGSDENDEILMDSSLLRRLLDPTDGEGPPEVTVYAPKVVDTLALLSGQEVPAQYDITVLANVDRLNERTADALLQALRAGRGLFVMLGDHADLASYNLHLHDAGTKIMPMRLTRPTGVEPGSSNARTPILTAPDHAVFSNFGEDLYREVFQAIPVYMHLGVAAGSMADDALVLARLTDPDQSPLLVAYTVDDGQALFLTSAASYRPDRWNRFEDPIVAFPLFHGIGSWLALPAQDPFNVQVGTELTCSLSARPEDVFVVKPERDGLGRVPVSENATPLPGARYALPPYPQTVFAGFYTYEMMLERDAGQERETLPFAVNVDPVDGDLTYASHAGVRERLGIPRVLTGLPSEGNLISETGSSELGPLLLYALLFFLLGEAAMARYVSARRS